MRILAVDDETDTLRFIRDLLAHAGHRVTTAQNAVEAMVHVQIAAFDLVVLDLMMPGIDGLQFAQFLSGQWNTFETPIVVASCRRDAEAKSWAKLNGCVRYLEKPFSPAELLEAVAQAERNAPASERSRGAPTDQSLRLAPSPTQSTKASRPSIPHFPFS